MVVSIGSNVAEDPKILRLETESKDTDIRISSIARRVRWKQLMKQHAGKIDLALAKSFEADHFDTYRGKCFRVAGLFAVTSSSIQMRAAGAACLMGATELLTER